MLFKQLFDSETWTYTYLLGDPATREAVLIDPVNTHINDYLTLLADLNLTLTYSLETHVHADHITAGGLLRQKLGAQTGVSALCGAKTADIQIRDGDVFNFGLGEQIRVIATPGHTPGSLSFGWRDRVFTGDCLLIGGCGRTDFQGGDAGTQYDSLQKLFRLPDETLVYPGHDYRQKWVSSIRQEKTANPRVAGKTRQEFIEIMNNLNLPKPRLLDEAVPANRFCGLEETQRQDAAPMKKASAAQPAATSANQADGGKYGLTAQDLVAQAKQHITEIDADKVRLLLREGGIVPVDVREEQEYNAGHIDHAVLLPRGLLEFKIGMIAELADKTKPVLVYCQTGGRSALAALTLKTLGYQTVLSMAGGYNAWQKAAA